MSRWGNRTQSEKQDGLDFNVIFEGEVSALNLINSQHYLEQMKRKNAKFTQKIILPKHRTVLQDLIDIALRPSYFAHKSGVQINRRITYAAIQTLTNLSQQFAESVFAVEEDGCAEDEVVQVGQKNCYPLLNYVLAVLSQKRPLEENVLAYLSKIIAPFLYQKQAQIMELLSTNKSILDNILRHFYSKSASDLLCKFLEIDNQTDFYVTGKIQIIRRMIVVLAEQEQEQYVEENVQNYGYVLEFMLEKYEDKYDTAKYLKLVVQLVSEKSLVDYLIKTIEKYSHSTSIKSECLRTLQIFMRFHLTRKNANKDNEGDNDTKVGQAIKMQPQILHQIQQLIKKHTILYFATSKLQLMHYYKLVRCLLTINPSSTDHFFTLPFAKQTFTLMVLDQNNDIIHNLQQDIIVMAVQHSQQVYQILLQEEVGFWSLLTLHLSQKNSNKCYQNQLFHVCEAITAKAKELSSTVVYYETHIQDKIHKKREFYATLIGGNPRFITEQKWDNFEIQDCKPQIIKKQVEINQPETNVRFQIEQLTNIKMPYKPRILSENFFGLSDVGMQVTSEEQDMCDPQPGKQNEGDHFFDDFQLPLDSDKEEDQENGSKGEVTAPNAVKGNQQAIVYPGDMPAIDQMHLLLHIRYLI